MSHGMRVIGSHGVLQIDETFKNLVMVGSGQVEYQQGYESWSPPSDNKLATNPYIVGYPPGSSGSPYEVIVYTTTDYAAIRNGGQVVLPWVNYHAATGTYGGPLPEGYYSYPLVKWWRFDSPPSLTTLPGSYGLVVNDASGNITYRADLPPIRVVQQTTIPPATYDESFSMPGTNVGIAISGSCFKCVQDPYSSVGHIQEPFFKTQNGILYKQWRYIPVYNGQGYVTSNKSPTETIGLTYVDLTGY